MSESSHVSVMVTEVMEALDLQPGETVVDGTVGLGGHSREIAAAIKPGGRLIAMDWDKEMLAIAESNLQNAEVSVDFYRGDYRELPEAISSVGLETVDGILMDLGLNNAQIEDESRGISFKNDAPLDMRMDRTRDLTAEEVVNEYSAHDIERILLEYGDERWARRIAQVIVDRRKQQRIETTLQLVDCILAAVPAAMRDKRIHPATRTFQALRIYVNRELDGLQEAIMENAKRLAPKGRMSVLSYHSGEDRAVKRAFRTLSDSGEFELVNKKPLTPSDTEVATNPKSRSAKLRSIKRNEVTQ